MVTDSAVKSMQFGREVGPCLCLPSSPAQRSAVQGGCGVAAGHGYDDLDPAEYDRCLQMVLAFLDG